MEEMAKHGEIGVAAMKSGMDRKTARKYVAAGELPSNLKKPRTWRTRADPFSEDWPELVGMLEAAPELQAKTLFEYLLAKRPLVYEPGQLRTMQRRVRRWRAQHGPPQEVFFAQVHRPGEAMQTDFTWATELGVTILGEPYAHMLCHSVLPYSNWQWATPCVSESMAALSEGVQNALFRLGRRPTWHQTDNSSAATHDLRTGKRGFNHRYVALMRHLDVKPRTTKVGAKEQNGDVESLNGALKRRLEQHLILRGSRDFESREAYVAWLHEVLTQANALRATKVQEELAVMRPLLVKRLATYETFDVKVSSGSTIRIKQNTYSVPSRLKNQPVRVRVHDDRLEVFHHDALQLTIERLPGRNGHRIDYRHIIWSLVRKPGAFRRYRYREDLFPTVAFRQAYDALQDALEEHRADLEYLRVLHLAASTMEADVELALQCLLEAGDVPLSIEVKELVVPRRAEIPELEEPKPNLGDYDSLLREVTA